MGGSDWLCFGGAGDCKAFAVLCERCLPRLLKGVSSVDTPIHMLAGVLGCWAVLSYVTRVCPVCPQTLPMLCWMVLTASCWVLRH